mmetsp:Transcript_12638/g.21384  ORF Transcript_12638/g.21384 Transcript_12638/m.21384 type:complete len:508 (-) Transcript_12638:113-1636(-)
MPSHMEVKRELINDVFDSWVNDGTLVERTERHELPCAAFEGVCSSDLGKVRYKAQAQHNHLLEPSPGLILFVGADLCFYRISITPKQSPFQKQSSIDRFLGPPQLAIEGFLEGFSPSIVQVGDSKEQRSSFVVCYGHGDLSVVLKDPQGRESWFIVGVTNWPNAIRPLKVEAAVRTSAGIIQCLVWGTHYTRDSSGDEVESGMLLAVTIHDGPAQDGECAEPDGPAQSDAPLVSEATQVMDGAEPPELAIGAANTSLLVFAAFDDGTLSTPAENRKAYGNETMNTLDKQLEVVCCDFSKGRTSQVVDDAGTDVPNSPKLHHWTLDINGTQTFGARSVLQQDALILTVGVKYDVHACIADVRLDSQEGHIDMAVHHVATVPAFAYVAMGKPKRKFLLLDATNRIAAVLEQERYAYIYESPCSKTSEEGNHIVVDVQSEGGQIETVLGGRFVAEDAGGEDKCWLIVLLEKRVTLLKLRQLSSEESELQEPTRLKLGAEVLPAFVWGADD